MERFRLLHVFFSILVFYGAPAWQTVRASPQHVDELINRGDYDAAVKSAELSSHPLNKLATYVKQRNLAEHPTWIALLHYRKGWSGKLTSQVDADHFFLSRSGKHDPENELLATIAALFAEQPKKPLRLTAYCRFVARRYWLAQQLGDLKSLLPQRECEEFERYQKFLGAEILTVIFPTAQPNSPSSAFGHTLLRIDRRDQNPETRMLNMSINFAAEVPENVSSFSYIIGGLAGGFKGKFRILPYYMKLREYRQIDNRDIWEYRLRLGQEQIDMILRHAYEMLIAHYDYYFFSENCSYHLLSLLDVAFPEQPLIDEFPLWTIPIDTIRVLEDRGLIESVQYIPSTTRIIKQRQRALTSQQNALAIRGTRSGVDAILSNLDVQSEKSQAQILDLISDYQRYARLSSGSAITSLSEAERKTLRMRSRVAVNTENPRVSPPGVSPEKGHKTARAALGVEVWKEKSYGLLQFRPAYHDFLDPVDGYSDNSAIDFFNFTLGWDRLKEKLFLRSFTLLDIQSLEPRDGFFKPVSWRTRISWEKYDPEHPVKFSALGGAGLAWRAASHAPLGYLFLEGALVDNSIMKNRTTLVAGTRLGLLWEPLQYLRLSSEISYEHDTVNSLADWRWVFRGSFAFYKQTALVLEASRVNRLDYNVNSERRLEAMVRFYF